MKELSIAGKATRYDEALKAAVIAHKDEDRHLKATLERIFPELKESEDERIKNLIYCLIRDRSDNRNLLEYNGVTVEQALAWLEKQGEQKPAWSEEDESILQGIWDEILANKHNAKEYEWKTYNKFLDWLKSLRPQNRWKPSGEQMAALKFVIESLDNMFTAIGYMDNYTKPHLEEILEALKKLMEE